MLMFLHCRSMEVVARTLPILRTFPNQPHHHSASDRRSYQKGRNCHPRERGERYTIHLDLGKRLAVYHYLAFVSQVGSERRESPSTMMNIPTEPNESTSAISNLEESIPIKYQDLSTCIWKIRLAYFRSDADIIENAEPHRLVTLCMVSRRSDYRNGVLDFP